MAERVEIRQQITTSESIALGEKFYVCTAYLKVAEPDKHFHKKSNKEKIIFFQSKLANYPPVRK